MEEGKKEIMKFKGPQNTITRNSFLLAVVMAKGKTV
jgi:hypothetical protein